MDGNNRAIVIGIGVSGNIFAGHLKKMLPDVEIKIIGPQGKKRPIVGESLTEFSCHTIRSLGMGTYLEEKHVPKYGLTFYFKEKLNDTSSPTYAVHEALTIPPLPSCQLNRFTFDEDILAFNQTQGTKYVDGMVKNVWKEDDGLFRVEFESEGQTRIETAKWVIDASGRTRFLAKKMGLHRPPPYQRSTFWFRLYDYDEKLLTAVDGRKPEQYAFESYFATHHYMGKGNWIWCIPISTKEHKNLISIGITFRPDILQKSIRTMDEFMAQVRSEHPLLARFIESGKIDDVNAYSNYFYECKQIYSPQGWFIIGDAGFAVDPLYSTGMVQTSLQAHQVVDLIKKDKEGELTPQTVLEYESWFMDIRATLSEEVSTLYEVMHDPYQCHVRMHTASILYFFSWLPFWMSGYMTNITGIRFMRMMMRDGRMALRSFRTLLKQASEKQGEVGVEQLVNHYEQTVNWDFWGPDEKQLSGGLAHLAKWLNHSRFTHWKKSGYQNTFEHLKFYAANLVNIVLMSTILKGKTLKESSLIAKLSQSLAATAERPEYMIGGKPMTSEMPKTNPPEVAA